MSSEKMLDGKAIVVTGSGRGIGRAIAIMLADHGAQVRGERHRRQRRGRGRGRTPADEVVSEIESRGGTAVANFNSVAEWDSAHAIIQSAIDNFGRIDGVVNNAGILRDTIFHKMTEEQFDIVSAGAPERFLQHEPGLRAALSRSRKAAAWCT